MRARPHFGRGPKMGEKGRQREGIPISPPFGIPPLKRPKKDTAAAVLALVASADARSPFVPGRRDASLISPRCIRHRRRFGEILLWTLPFRGFSRSSGTSPVTPHPALRTTCPRRVSRCPVTVRARPPGHFLDFTSLYTRGPPPQPSEAGAVGRGGGTERASRRACAAARDVESPPTTGGASVKSSE